MTTVDFAGTPLIDRPSANHPVAGLSTVGGSTSVRPTARRGITFVQLHDELWRVTRSDGEVLGYVEGFLDPRGRRYRSKRLVPLQKRFLVLGEFWSFDDAVDCLRFG